MTAEDKLKAAAKAYGESIIKLHETGRYYFEEMDKVSQELDVAAFEYAKEQRK